jgi:hypothetical protein
VTLSPYNYGLIISKGEICDKDGESISSPQLQEMDDCTDWGPFHNHLRFKVADMLFWCMQMSGSHIDEILQL